MSDDISVELHQIKKNQKYNNFRMLNDSISKLWHKVYIKSSNNYNEQINWCFENCHGRFSYEIYHILNNGPAVTFYFKFKNDYTLFTLSWT